MLVDIRFLFGQISGRFFTIVLVLDPDIVEWHQISQLDILPTM